MVACCPAGVRVHWPLAEGLTTLVPPTASPYFRQQGRLEPEREEDETTTVRDIMNAGVTCVGEHETLSAAARHLPKHAVVQFDQGDLFARGDCQLVRSEGQLALAVKVVRQCRRLCPSTTLEVTRCAMRSH